MYELDPEALKNVTPKLHHLLQFADRQEVETIDFDDTLIQLLGLKQSALPYARACKTASSGNALLIKPVHLKADINNAIVFPVETGVEDNQIIINDLKDYFKVDCYVEMLDENLWVMQLLACEPVENVPHYLSAVGKKVTHYIEQAKTNLQWFKLINEMQMFMYQHPINQQRLQAGKLAINSLWCWGADRYNGEKKSSVEWFSDDLEMKQLGQLYTGNANELSALKEINNPANQSTNFKASRIVIDLSLLKALKSGQDSNLMQILEQLEQTCINPLLESNPTSLRVHTAATTCLYYRPHYAFKFWKKGDWTVKSY